MKTTYSTPVLRPATTPNPTAPPPAPEPQPTTPPAIHPTERPPTLLAPPVQVPVPPNVATTLRVLELQNHLHTQAVVDFIACQAVLTLEAHVPPHWPLRDIPPIDPSRQGATVPMTRGIYDRLARLCYATNILPGDVLLQGLQNMQRGLRLIRLGGHEAFIGAVNAIRALT